MKPHLLKVSKDHVSSFSARHETMPNVNNRWHYHPEVELVYFKKGNGTQFIGDSINQFLSGDIVLIGSNLPHYWQFDNSYIDFQNSSTADVSVIHFDERFLGEAFIQLPENKAIKYILEKSKRGISISKSNESYIGSLIERVVNEDGCRKILLLIEVLLTIAEHTESKLMASVGFRNNFHEEEKDRVNAIYNYTINNFKKNITLHEISGVANISPNSFCKFFKSRNRKTYSQFIQEIRVGHACKLLIDDKLTIKEVCYESGFNNFASFHKYFKAIKGTTPLVYQKSFIKAG